MCAPIDPNSELGAPQTGRYDWLVIGTTLLLGVAAYVYVLCLG